MGHELTKRRKIFKIVPEPGKMRIQFRYVRLIIYTQLVCILILVIGFNVILQVILRTAQLGRYAEMQLGNIFFWMNLLFACVTVISVIVGGILSLHLSHRFIGPLYRIETTLKNAISEGKPVEIRIRQDDELHDLIHLLNEFLSKKSKNEQ